MDEQVCPVLQSVFLAVLDHSVIITFTIVVVVVKMLEDAVVGDGGYDGKSVVVVGGSTTRAARADRQETLDWRSRRSERRGGREGLLQEPCLVLSFVLFLHPSCMFVAKL